MVYHHPDQQRWFNSKWLGPLRILTSDNQSAELMRKPIVLLGRVAFAIYGLTEIITKVPWSDEVKAWYKKYVNRPVWQWLTSMTLMYGLYTYVKLVNVKFRAHLKPPADWKPYKFFRVTDNMPLTFDDPDRKQHLPGAAYVRSRATWYADPVLTSDNGRMRALNTYGMSYLDFFFMECTVGLEYPLTALTRIFRHYCWFPYFNRKADRYRLYQSLLNSSMICYTCYDQSNKEEYGYVVLPNVRLPYGQTATRTFDKIVAVVNHETFELEKVITYFTREEDKKVERRVWGSRNQSENDGGLDVDESLHQAGLILAVTVAYFSHGVVHWWSTAVAALEPSVWSTQHHSNNITQWMNSQSIFMSWVFYGNSMETTNNFIVFNNANGFPIHGLMRTDVPRTGPLRTLPPADLQHALGERSTFHQMSSAVQTDLAALMKAKYDPELHVLPETEGIMAATIRHNLEHFFVADNLPIFTDGSCILLQSDLSGLLMCLIHPIDYWSRTLKVRSFRDDISQAIYKASVKRWAELKKANEDARAAGRIPQFAELGKFCDKYLCIGCAV